MIFYFSAKLRMRMHLQNFESYHCVHVQCRLHNSQCPSISLEHLILEIRLPVSRQDIDNCFPEGTLSALVCQKGGGGEGSILPSF